MRSQCDSTSSNREFDRTIRNRMLGLYLHIPFCSAICNYCNFNRGLFDAELKTRYVEALTREIRRVGRLRRRVPSRRHHLLRRRHAVAARAGRDRAASSRPARGVSTWPRDREVTLEANPESVTAERLAAYRAAGVNRLSFGVQSFRDDELRRLSRLHSADRARGRVRRGAGGRLRQRQPRPDDVAARAAGRRLARVGGRRHRASAPSTCRSTCSRSIPTRRSRTRWRARAGRRRQTTTRRRCT